MYTAASLRGDAETRPASMLDRVIAAQTLVVLVVAIQEPAAVGLDEALQIFVALRIVGIVQQTLHLDPVGRDVIVQDVAQHPDEGQVDRVLERFEDGRVGGSLPSDAKFAKVCAPPPVKNSSGAAE